MITKLPALAGVTALAAAAGLSACSTDAPTPVAQKPTAASTSTPPRAPAPAVEQSVLSKIAGPDTLTGGYPEDLPRPADPHNLIGANWPGDAAGVYQDIASDAAFGRLTDDRFNAKSRATAGEIADRFLTINGGRVAESVGVTAEGLAGRGLHTEDIDIMLVQAVTEVADTEKLIAGDVMQAQLEIDNDSALQASVERSYRTTIARRYTELTGELAGLGDRLMHDSKHPLPSRDAAGAEVYAAVTPSGSWYAVDAEGRPAPGHPAPADALPVYPLPPLRPVPEK